MAKLVVYKNKKEFQTLELNPDKEYLAGRAPGCDILLDDVVFSRQHLKVFYSQNLWTVQSLSKYSQLRLNGKDLDYFQLKNQDRFTTFDFEFVFVDDSLHIAVAETLDLDDKTTDIQSAKEQPAHDEVDDKTFVPAMSSQEWSVGVPYLIVHKPSGQSQTLRLEGDYWVIGRDEGCDVVVNDPKASREHCEIYRKNSQYYIVDKGSSNGTLFNYKKLSSELETPLKSGDQIQIGKYLLIFEIRDPMFTEKISHLPVTMEEMIMSQAVGFSADDSDQSQRAVRLSTLSPKKKKMFMVGGAIFILFVAFYFSGNNNTQNKNMASRDPGTAKNRNMDMSPEQKEYVEKTYNLAKTLYTQGKYELALTEIEKIKTIVPDYKDSKEIAQFSKSAIDTLMEQKEIERKDQEQHQLALKVEDIVNQCQTDYQRSLDSAKLEGCLEAAVDLDPENAHIKQVRLLAEQNDERKEAKNEQISAYNSRVRSRKKIFEQAEQLQKQGKLLDAISTYGRHIASTLPDPEHLESKSKQEVKELQGRVAQDIRKLKSQAEDAHSKKDYKTAITKLEDAIRLNPQSEDVRKLHEQYSKELLEIVKNLYGDSVIEENLGNIESAKEKWKKITNMDMEYGDYYKKANAKLRKY